MRRERILRSPATSPIASQAVRVSAMLAVLLLAQVSWGQDELDTPMIRIPAVEELGSLSLVNLDQPNLAAADEAKAPSIPASPMDPLGEMADKKYGEQPAEQHNEQIFLRTQTVLLQPGQFQFDTGFFYLLQQFNFPTINNGNLVRGDLTRRQLVAPLAVRYGWSERIQLFAYVPLGWRDTSFATNSISDPTPFEISSNHGGIGDVLVGGSYLWRKGGDGTPDIILTGSATLPTGEGFFPSSIFFGGLGNGVPGLAGQFLVVHTYDPVVVFWGAGYKHNFQKRIQGIDVQFGEEFSYQLGAGFAANERVTLSAAFLGNYITESKFNGQNIPGTTLEPMRMRFSVTAFRNCRIVEPFAEIGMTYRAPASRIGVTWTF